MAKTVWTGGAHRTRQILIYALIGAGVTGSLALYRMRNVGSNSRRAPVHYRLSPLGPLSNRQVAPLITLDQAREAIVDRIQPAVVEIQVSAKLPHSRQQMPGYDNSPFNQFFQFFGQQPNQPQFEQGIGSGFIISPDGYVVTNRHVVANATNVEVTLSNNETFNHCKVVGTDALTDLAVVKISATNLPSVPWGDSNQLKVGQGVMAFGHPFGIPGITVTRGIISGLGRSSYLSSNRAPAAMIQTDAAVNQGNSGGPLVNDHGQVIGIDSAILTPSGAFAGVAYAVPSSLAKPTTAELIQYGHVNRGFLGIVLNQFTPSMAEQFHVPANTKGALVGQVNPGSPGAKAGLQVGDIITRFNGHKITSTGQLQVDVQLTAPGTTAQMTVLRNGQPQTLSVTVGKYQAPGQEQQASKAAQTHGAKLGIRSENLTAQIRDQLDLPSFIHGVIIDEVEPGSPAYNAGLERGDIIEQVNRQPVNNVNDLQNLLSQAPAGKPVLLLIYQGRGSNGGSVFIQVYPSAGGPGK